MKLAHLFTFLYTLMPLYVVPQVFTESFESGSGGYSSSITECTDNSGDYFILTDGSNIGVTLTGTTGSFFAAQDIDAATCPASVSGTETLAWSSIDITGCSGLSLSIDLAEDDDGTNQDWDDADFVHIEVSIDGGIYQPLIWIEKNGTGTNGEPELDIDFDGSGDGTAITDTWQTFSNTITGTGTTMDLKIFFSLDSGDEDIALDNIVITGTGCSAVSGNTITTTSITGNPWTVDCTTNDSGTVAFTSTGTFNTSNIYTAQLSDATGAFSSPVNIGTLTSTANSGTVNIVIPAGTEAGNAYRIRVMSDDPVVAGSDNGAGLTINNNTATATLIMNEMSNGPSGSKEYYEMLVVGSTCTEVSIQNLIFDDNNGDWGANGIASGHMRFTNAIQWGCVSTGSLIVVYNDGDVNLSVPGDDETDANADNVYILPVTSVYLENCTSDPFSGSFAYNVGGCAYTTATSWTSLGMSNSGDIAQTRNTSGGFIHGIGYGGATAPAGGVDFGTSGGGGDAFIFDNSVNDDYTNASNFSFGAVSTFESPGVSNTANNSTYIGSLLCPVLPVNMLYFNLEQTDNSVYLFWETASEENCSHYTIERSNDAITYESIGRISGAGTASINQKYHFVDEDPPIGVSFYRLRQVDYNGDSNLSGFRVARFYEGELVLTGYRQNYDVFSFVFSNSTDGIDVMIYNTFGQLIKRSETTSNTIDFDVSDLASGIYIMRAGNGYSEISRKIFIK